MNAIFSHSLLVNVTTFDMLNTSEPFTVFSEITEVAFKGEINNSTCASERKLMTNII